MTDPTRRTTRRDLNRLSPDPAWPTKCQDLHAAVAILQRHVAAGEPLRLLEQGARQRTASGGGFALPGGFFGFRERWDKFAPRRR